MDISRRRWITTAALTGAGSVLGSKIALGSDISSAKEKCIGPCTENIQAPLQLFNNDLFNGETLYAFGAASSRTSEIGEVLWIVNEAKKSARYPKNPALIKRAAFDAYYAQFGSYADNLQLLAIEAEPRHTVTARQRYLRAAQYAAEQLFFVLGTSSPDAEEEIFLTTEMRWKKAVSLLDVPPIEFSVSSPFGTIPGYFFRPEDNSKPRPTLIISNGSDGQHVDIMSQGLLDGLLRGYNVALFEGPGQMSLLFVDQIPFTADWDRVVQPVLDWVKAQPGVDKVGLMGISFSGQLCARAAANCIGLDAVVLNPGSWSTQEAWAGGSGSKKGYCQTMELFSLIQNRPDYEQPYIRANINKAFSRDWKYMDPVDRYSIYKRGEVFTRELLREARLGVPVSDYYGLLKAMAPFVFDKDLEKINIPTLVTHNEGEAFYPCQSQEAFAMLKNLPESKKRLVTFTVQQGTQLHDQPVGPSVACEVIFDWLDDYLR